jgi:hypothetical protein
MNLITDESFLPAQDPTSLPKPIELGAFIKLTPHVPPAPSDRLTLEIAAEWKARIGSPDPNDTRTIRSTEIASTVTLLKDHYCALLTEPESISDSDPAPNDFHLLLFRADLLPPTATYSTTPTLPAPAKTPSRQIILDVQTISFDKSSLADGIVEWAHSQTGGWPWGIQMGYTPDKTFTDALLKHLDSLYAQGLARRLAGQRLTTQDGYEARFKALKEEWFSLRPAQTAEDPDPQTELASIASGAIITATPTIGDANNITLKLKIEWA